MASVANSVRKSIADWMVDDYEFSMLHACNAIDGTAAKVSKSKKVGERFRNLIRDNYDILGPMGMPGIDLHKTKWPVQLDKDGSYTFLDLAEIIYRVHRCTQGHGAELPNGWELTNDVARPLQRTRVTWKHGKLSLSDRTIFGLLAIAVLAKENQGQMVPSDYFLSFESRRFLINQWWGRKKDFLSAIHDRVQEIPSVHLDFSEWMQSPSLDARACCQGATGDEE